MVRAPWRHGDPREQGSRTGRCGWITSFLRSSWQSRCAKRHGVRCRVARWSGLQVDALAIPSVTLPAVWGPRGTRAGGVNRRGTLFGPEGASPRGDGESARTLCSHEHLENFRASASIWAKLIRAHGGCLGARSRRRTREAAKSPGEPPTGQGSGGVRMGKPGRGHARSPRSEHIGPEEGTARTDTSQ
jgi:hypothetical protein